MYPEVIVQNIENRLITVWVEEYKACINSASVMAFPVALDYSGFQGLPSGRYLVVNGLIYTASGRR